MKQPLRILLGLLVVAFTGLIVWAGSEKGLSEGFRVVLAERWGVVALADLYLGFMIAAAWVFALESRRITATLWTVALFALGNPVLLIYFWLRLGRLGTVRAALLGTATNSTGDPR